MKKFLLVALLVVGLAAISTPVFAFDLSGYTGPIQFKYNNWDEGTLYSPDTQIDNKGKGSGIVDGWGIVDVTNIQGKNAKGKWYDLWTPGSSGESIEGMVYGLSDDIVNIGAGGTGTIENIGGKIVLYLQSGQDVGNLDPSVGPQLNPANPNNNENWVPTDYWNATDGQLFLQADFVGGIDPYNSAITYLQHIDVTNPATGHGAGNINVTGGAYQHLFAPDMLLASNYIAGGQGDYGWAFTSYDPVQGRAVPEPASMLLLGSGLFGLIGLRKKRS
jgi:hypothetical protein